MNSRMDKKPKPFWRRLAPAVLCSALIPLALEVVVNYAAITPRGSESFLWLEVFTMGFLMLAAFIAVPVCAILCCFRRIRAHAGILLACSVAILLGTVTGWKIGHHIRMNAFLRLAERSSNLIQAIKAYELDHGEAPPSLDSLVPKYLAEVPSTGMGAYPKFEYVARPSEGSYEGNPWVLSIFTPSGGINFDQFMYFPKQNYPEKGFGGWLERIGDWAYVHE